MLDFNLGQISSLVIKSIMPSYLKNNNLYNTIWKSKICIHKYLNNKKINYNDIYYSILFYLSFLLLSSTSNIKFKETDISIFHYIFFPLLSVLPFCLHSYYISMMNKIFIFHYFCTNKSFLKISMNNTSSLRCLWSLFNSPTTHFILSTSKEINQI